jgi:peptide chain release factor 3
MEIERQRGISVATSVMGFEYNGKKINILDTPGHKDFAEDTFRTLTAVDSAIVVIDVAKGVEIQTEKLVKVCRMRKTPLIFFINKLDRPGKDSYELIDEIEQKLDVKIRPLSWPIGMGQDLKGVYNLYERKLNLFSPSNKQTISDNILEISDLADPQLDELLGEKDADTLREEVELIEGVYPEFEIDEYLNGNICPVFFGSALNNFGVQELLNCFTEIAPYPTKSNTEEREVDAFEDKFSGFVFKIHANMDPKHRDRIAFVRICSGKFERNTNYLHVRLDKKMKFSNPTAFMAEKKELLEEAFPGDIVGLYDSGNFKIGDTLTEGEKINFKGIPSFSPELFRYVENADPMKSKQLAKGLSQLMDEGVAQLFIKEMNGRKIIGTVGQLQFDVIQYRLEHEYGAKCRYESVPLKKAYWIGSENRSQLQDFKRNQFKNMATDKHGHDVYLSDSDFFIQMLRNQFPEVKFYQTSELKQEVL